MKQIKFKIWCKGTDFNLNFNKPGWWGIHSYLINKYYPIGEMLSNPEHSFWEHFVLCQFTGFLDKNGKEVYLGDIVVHKKRTKVVVWDSAHLCYILIWPQVFTSINDEYRNGSNSQESGFIYDKVTGTKVLEVIGNVLGNPELLNNE